MAEYIERKKVYEMLDYIEAEKSVSAAIDRAAHLIDRIPSADVQEVQRGQWEEELLISGEIKYTCSICGQIFQGESLDFNYCPNCGAKMDGKDG